MNRHFLLLCLLSACSLAYARLKGEGIIGGETAKERQFPYQISLQVNGNRHICGGGFIGERFVLTAGHCVIDTHSGQFVPANFKVVYDTTDVSVPGKGRSVDVEKIYVPNSFRPPGSLQNDIAVLKLKQKVDLSHGLRKLDLPRSAETYAGQMAKISGYGWNWIEVYRDPINGKKQEGTGTTDYKLRYLDTKILSYDECRRINTYTPVYQTHICGQAVQRHINGKVEGICSGDSGGSLVIGNTVVGVVSVSPTGCEENREAAAYTRVSSYVSFIDKVMSGNIQGADIREHTVGGNSGSQIPGYPPQQPGYPPQQPGYPPQQPGYPPQQPGYPPQHPGYPPQHPGYPPQHPGFPQQQPGFPQQQPGFPPQQPGYPPFGFPTIPNFPQYPGFQQQPGFPGIFG